MYAKTARVRTSRTWLLAAGAVAPLAPGLCLSFGLPVWVYFATMFGSLVGLQLAWMLLPKRRHGVVSADAHGLRLGDRFVARRASIHSACVRSRDGASWLRLGTKRGYADVEIADENDERALFAALRLDERGVVARFTAPADRRRSRANVGRLVLAVPVPLLVMSAALAVTWRFSWPLGLGGLAIMLGSLVLQLRASLRTFENVWIGSDGIRRRSPASRARFTPFSQIESVSIDGADLVVRLAGGGEIAWHAGWRKPSPVLAAMTERIQRGLQAHRGLVASHAAAQLARGERSLERWIADLRAAADPDRGTYRAPAIPADELWKTVENAVAPPTARAGAAVALRRALDDAGRKRLLDVSAACASTSLRRALESVASDEPVEQRLALVRDA